MHLQIFPAGKKKRRDGRQSGLGTGQHLGVGGWREWSRHGRVSTVDGGRDVGDGFAKARGQQERGAAFD